MYDFNAQKEMFIAAKHILDGLNLSLYALGGGTALSAYYWQHRNSTDIDIFLFEQKSYLRDIRNTLNDSTVIQMLNSIGYTGEIKYPGNYLEIEIDKYRKIQFFENKKHHCPSACDLVELWGESLYLEHINEIIYKKIYFRAEKKNPRDIFDIAMALHKTPFVFKTILEHQSNFIENLMYLRQALNELIHSPKDEEMKRYLGEIQYISPAEEYQTLAHHAPEYLFDYLEVFLVIVAQKADDEILLRALEDEVYRNVVSEKTLTPKQTSSITIKH